jgi:hypothetical protein
MRFTVELTVRDVKSRLVIPATMTADAKTIVVEGQLVLSQAGLGLTPYSVLGGGLRVRDTVEADYHLVALRAD